MTESFASLMREAPAPTVTPAPAAPHTVTETPTAAPTPPLRVLRPEDGPTVTWDERRRGVLQPEVVEHPTPVLSEPIEAQDIVTPRADAEVLTPPRPRRAARNTAARDTAEMLNPKGRMLSRAFGATGHQRTVLSEALGKEPAADEATDPSLSSETDGNVDR